MATRDDLKGLATEDDLIGLATEEFVQRVVAQSTSQMVSRMNEQTRWFAGIVLQTVAVLTAAVTITRALGGG